MQVVQLTDHFVKRALRNMPKEIIVAVDHLNSAVRYFSKIFVDLAPLSESFGLLKPPPEIERQAQILSNTYTFLFGVRTTVLLSDFVAALDRRQLVSAALAGRAAIETAAAAVYISQILGGERKSDNADIVRELKRAAFGGRFPWAEVLGSGDDEFESVVGSFASGNPRPAKADPDSVNILTMIKYLDHRGPVPGLVQMVYENLSDFCHPAVGTAVAFLRTSAGTTRVHASSGDRVTGLFWCMMGAHVAPICETGLTAMLDAVEKRWPKS